MRVWVLMVMAIILSVNSSYALTTAQAMRNPRHAALVIDADSGRVLRNENASARRYPASLTKMMTLYMTFRALQAGQISMDQQLPVTKNAASQPQTNIALKPTDTISVRECILALVVRSANDAAMVLAEALGKNADNFAVMMTSTAHQLGMNNTVFRNPNGLPDNSQFTTAFDMARLGIALRRDFPQYYGMFKTQQFSYQGRNYTGHNRVLGRLDGVDGIKTGYIRLSGFNLVSSMKKDGVNIVAVVMGGNSGSERDNYMVSILKDGFQRQYAALHNGHPADNVSVADASKQQGSVATVKDVAALVPAAGTTVAPAVAATKVAVAVTPIVPAPVAAQQPKEDAKVLQVAAAQVEKSSRNVAVRKDNVRKPFQVSVVEKKIAKRSDRKVWGVQVGAFRDKDMARAAVNKASKMVKKGDMQPRVAIASSGNKSKPVHRALLSNLSRQEAMLACQRLQARGNQCLAIQVN